jgi:threonine dehydrogenase-like Zn-dependent dehydrogenase
MKVAAITGARQAGLVEVPDPVAAGDFALVKVHSAPMCAEYKGFVDGGKTSSLGHEAAGEVVAVAQAGNVKVGDRVVVMPQYPCGRCDDCLAGDYIYCVSGKGPVSGTATYAQYLLKNSWLLMPIPEGVSYEHASMACCGLGPTFGAMDLVGVDRFDTVLITGAGPVGLGGVINARYRGARALVVEANPYRAAKALKLGAEKVFDPKHPDVLKQILDATGGAGVDKAIDCSGVPAAHRLCIDAARRRGQVAFVGETYAYGATPLSVSPDMIRKGLTLKGSWHYNIARFADLMRVIVDSPGPLDELITHRMGMSQVQQAFEISASGLCAKIVLDPWK